MSDKRAQNRRPAPISYRPPKGLVAEFYARVAASGLSVNAFITACIFGRSRRRRDERQALAQLLGQAAQISDRLHDLALTGGSENALLIEAAREDLAEIRAALLAMMGRRP